MANLTEKEYQVYRKRAVELLRRVETFARLPEPQFEEVLRRISIEAFSQGEVIIEQNAEPQDFYMILDGQVRVVDTGQEPPRLINYLSDGDFFGERALIENTERAAMVDVVVDTHLARFNRNTWNWLLANVPGIADYFRSVERAYDARERIPFPGRHTDEVAVLSMSRHWLALLVNLRGPMLTLVAGLTTVVALASVTNLMPTVLLALTLFVLVISGFFFWYEYEEWANDSFIVSTKRVTHIERTIIYGEQREEAPLVQITDVMVDMPNFIASRFDYSNLIIRMSGTGDVIFNGVKNGDLIRDTIFEQRRLAAERVSASDIASIRRSIVDRMYWQAEHELEAAPLPAEEVREEHTYAKSHFQLPGLIRYYWPRVRQEDSGSIIWRKHYWVLLQMVSMPLTLGIISFLLLLSAVFRLFPFETASPVFVADMIWGLLALTVFCFLWYTYKYDDWYRDTYSVTGTQIIIVDSTPFGIRGESQQETTFDRIQNTNYESPNFFYRLLNMGHVIIQTASVGEDTNFVFENLYNPRDVQQEIFKRWYSFQDRSRARERSQEEERFTTWLREYHKMSTEMTSGQ